ncbi:MAG: histidinol-phosphate transaminase [Actinobacteria bacterium]|nr:histidinol-phosphate transaminase [Actinomycetota bacterium]
MAVTFVPALAGLELYRPGLPIEEVRRTYGLERVVKLASNEFPLPPFPEVRQAVLDAVDGLQRYPDGHSSVLREALAELYDRGPDQVVVGSGSCELVYLLALAVLRPGDQAVLPAPSFSPYRYVTVLCGAEPVKVRLRDHTHDLEAMAQAVTPRTRMLVVCNPNNPTGTHVPPSEIARLVERVPDDVLVVIDEAYVEFVTADDREGSLDIQRAHENVVVLRTFSKIYGLSGLRTGYGLCAPEVREALDKVRQPFNVNLLGQLAATEALKYPHRVAERREANARLRDRLAARLAELGRATVPSQANFVLVDIEGLSVPQDRVCEALLAMGVIVRDGNTLGCPGWARVTVGTEEEVDFFLEKLATLEVDRGSACTAGKGD